MIRQFLKYSAVGLASSLINVLFFNLFLLLFRKLDFPSPADFLIPQILAFVFSVLFSFLLNRKYVFHSEAKSQVPWPKALFRMYVTYSFTGVILSSALSLLWVYVFAIPKEILPLLNDSIGFPVTFFLNKYWSFRES